MIGCNMSTEMVDLGIHLKELLKKDGNESDVATVDYFLCQYDYLCINDKKELIESMFVTFNSRRVAEMFISDVTLQCIKRFCDLLNGLKLSFNEIHNVNFSRFLYKDKEYLVNRDVFEWVITSEHTIFLLKENNQYFEDNLVALNSFGEVIWDSKKDIDCRDRRGAIFVGLSLFDETTIVVNAYIGINYYVDIKTGTVKDKIITK